MFDQLLEPLSAWAETGTLLQTIKTEKGTVLGQGVGGTASILLLALLWREQNRRMLIVTGTPSAAEHLSMDLSQLVGEEHCFLFPAYDLLAHEEAYEKEVAGQRLSVLGKLLTQEKIIVVTSWPALVRKLLPPKELAGYFLSVAVGNELPRDRFLRQLVTMGYNRVTKVETAGEFSVRGDIIDLYPLNRPDPLRIEFFGDEVDSIRTFDPETQKSITKVEKILIIPAREGLWTAEQFKAATPMMETVLNQQCARLRKTNTGERTEEAAVFLEKHYGELLEKVTNGLIFPGMDRFLPLVRKDLVPFWTYLPDALLVLHEPIRGSEYLRSLEEENTRMLGGFIERGLVLPEETALYLSFDEIQAFLAQKAIVHLSTLNRTLKGSKIMATVGFPMRLAPDYAGQFSKVIKDLKLRLEKGWTVVIGVSGAERRRGLTETLKAEELLVNSWPEAGPLVPGQLYLAPFSLTEGVELPADKVILLTETELYGRKRRPKRVKARFGKEGVKLSDFTELTVGDYVVHINHGIGRYLGLKKLEINGAEREYLEIEYADQDRLFVPTDQLGLIQKYIGLEENPPRINRLGGGDWQKVKSRVQESIKEMADKLLLLYADRFMAKGYAFPPDTVWQKEFEDAFFYEETPDQLRAVMEIKKDMESDRPMDRLLCGDVGYGKTEVAMRAAFKAVTDGKQVAVLVPTTILAQQHYQTFLQRFSGYPVNIGLLSRFQSPGEQEKVVKGLKDGTIDLVIGTHRLLSKDVAFKDLGLLIVDEEQKFGVIHKERLKELKKNVDALTITATPIPRTLHMSLIGIRDISVIETPPEDRFPVKTYVIEFNEEVIVEAIRRELDRGGQVFFVYNRVQTIDRMAGYLQQLIPEARVDIAHGQMSEDQLEEIMLSFYEGASDILVCTTIIENGLDIPNVNTIIVYDADRLGLAQLYQLRGRVGRSNRVAYAYFTFRKDKLLSEVAEKRLATIRDFTDLGSGFKIAQRDLEIRGAGNLLGPEQHGHIAAIGFDLYCRLLEEAMKERRGEKKPDTPDPTIEVVMDAYISEEYISDPAQKVEIYKKIAAITSLVEADEVEEEIEDRFGDLPTPVRNLLEIARLKVLAKQAGISTVTTERGDLVARFLPGLTLDTDRVTALLINHRGQVRYQPGRQQILRWRTAGRGAAETWKLVKDTLLYLLGEKKSV
ncbi:MAG: transcription-repair coupling factor [Firmicutes bacterium]|nr:transcription-repair coupling factor [Bacillota bacterium]